MRQYATLLDGMFYHTFSRKCYAWGNNIRNLKANEDNKRNSMGSPRTDA